jgi:hypothetical protein
MNKEIILFHLEEASEELERTIRELKEKDPYDFEEFQVAMGHLYHHLNTAWNDRNCTDEEHRKSSKFNKWRNFPVESDFFL